MKRKANNEALALPEMMQTREAWLCDLMGRLAREVFEPVEAGSTENLPKWRVTCGWPWRARERKAIGQCWSHSASSGGFVEIFISPVLDEVSEVDHVLAHELCHAIAGNECGHGGAFVKLARKIGLVGKPTATIAGDELRAKLDEITASMPPYPHARLNPSERGGGGRPKQSTRMLKAECPECHYVIRSSRKWFAKGMPTCHCGTEFVCEEDLDGDEGDDE